MENATGSLKVGYICRSHVSDIWYYLFCLGTLGSAGIDRVRVLDTTIKHFIMHMKVITPPKLQQQAEKQE